MATRHQVFKALRSAFKSKTIAKSLHDHTANAFERLQLHEQMCQERGISSWKMCGQLLDHLAYNQLTTKSPFGSWDSDQTIADHLGWPNRYYVKRAKAELLRVGLIETGLGKPLGERAPHTHYRLTNLVARLYRSVVKAIRRKAQSKKRAEKPNLVATRFPTKTFDSPKRVVLEAHRPFRPEPIPQVSQPRVGNHYLELMRNRATAQGVSQ